MLNVAVLVALLLLIALALWNCPGTAPSRPAGPGPAARERYGPPPGARRALSHYELGDRGWPSAPWEYNANTASAISHMIERSA